MVIEVKGDGESSTRAEQGSELDYDGRRMSEIALGTWTIWRLWGVKWTNYNFIKSPLLFCFTRALGPVHHSRVPSHRRPSARRPHEPTTIQSQQEARRWAWRSAKFRRRGEAEGRWQWLVKPTGWS
ncbi:hypothetical protein TIFTF001_008762 [Ficus carica]|uniref:Uncharacterized protein n=1 Tax=Ficus carica TaxID=3494 RepID=A0AA88D206_FICCA|nr:hypothetical protein TIFTF001_008762 [Ficus carica]